MKQDYLFNGEKRLIITCNRSGFEYTLHVFKCSRNIKIVINYYTNNAYEIMFNNCSLINLICLQIFPLVTNSNSVGASVLVKGV